jgi:hypothetical protein
MSDTGILALKLTLALVQYGTHRPGCGHVQNAAAQCNCGWKQEVNNLLIQAKAAKLGISLVKD